MNLNTQQHQQMRRDLRPVELVFAGAQAGAYTLPEEMVAARDRLHEIAEAIGAVEIPPDAIAVSTDLASAMAKEGALAPDLGKRLLTADTKYETARAQLHVLRMAEAMAGSALLIAFVEF